MITIPSNLLTRARTHVSLTQILFAMPDLTKFCREDGLINEVAHRHRSLGYLCILPRTVSLTGGKRYQGRLGDVRIAIKIQKLKETERAI